MMLTPEQLADLRNAGPDYYVSGGTLKLLLARIDAQQARITDLEQDAARYQWLRDRRQSKSENLLATLAVRHENGWSWRSAVGEELDAAIDAAMQSTWPEDASDIKQNGEQYG